MIEVTFADDALKELYETGKTKDRRYKAICKKQKIVDGFVNAVNLMKGLNKAEDLAVYSYLHYEKLKHNYSGQSSVRLCHGCVERLLFTENEGGIKVELIKIDETHYGKKK